MLDRRGLPQFASQADRLAYYERHRLDSEQALLETAPVARRRASAVRARPQIEDALDAKQQFALLEPKCVAVAGWRKSDKTALSDAPPGAGASTPTVPLGAARLKARFKRPC